MPPEKPEGLTARIAAALTPGVRATALGVVSMALLVGVYACLSHRQHLRNPDDTTIPSWSQIQAGVERICERNPYTGTRWILVDAEATGQRLLLGLVTGIVGSVCLGLLMGCFKRAEAFFLPPLSLIAKIPPTAMLAVFFVMVGTGAEMYVAMIGFGILPTLSQAVFLAVKDVPQENIDKALTLGASRGEIIWNVIFSQIRPKIIDSIRLLLGSAMVYLIAAEMVCGDVGFGYRIRTQSRLLNMNVVYPYLVILGAFGLLMDGSLKWLVRKWCPWYREGGGS
jgi:NitT/TauT family transport system permease protein